MKLKTPLNELITLHTAELLKDKFGGIGEYNITETHIFCNVKINKRAIMPNVVEGNQQTSQSLEITIRRENLERVVNAKEIFYKGEQIYLDSISNLSPIKEKYITLDARVQSQIQYK